MGKYDDFLDGRSGDDVINGFNGNDTIVGGVGDDKMYGGDDNDSFLTQERSIDPFFDGKGSDYADTFINVETFKFSDIEMAATNIVSLRSSEETIVRIYEAILNREPDEAGFKYWLNDMENNSTENIAHAFTQNDEYKSKFGTPTNEEFVFSLYKNILNREPDEAGFKYWVDEINQTGNKGNMIVGFVNSQEYGVLTQDMVESYLVGVDLSGLWVDSL